VATDPTKPLTDDPQYYVRKIFIPGFTDQPSGRGASPTEAKNWFANLPETNLVAYQVFASAAAARGFATDRKTLTKLWNKGVDWTQTLNNPLAGNKLGIDPSYYLDYATPGVLGDEDESSRYGTTNQTDIRTTTFSTSSAAADINKVFSQEVGREATAKEIAAYQKGANERALKEPSKYVGQTTTSPGASVSKGSQTTGFDPTEFAKSYARSMPDYAENFAVRTFLDLINQSLSDPNRIGQVI
jgi:hypothetical protein